MLAERPMENFLHFAWLPMRNSHRITPDLQIQHPETGRPKSEGPIPPERVVWPWYSSS